MFAKFAIRLARADCGMEIGGELASSQLGGSVLPNRLLFTQELEGAILAAGRQQSTLTLNDLAAREVPCARASKEATARHTPITAPTCSVYRQPR